MADKDLTKDSEMRELKDRVERLERVVEPQRRRGGLRRESTRRILGLPLYSVAIGPDPEKNEMRGHARGWIAMGDIATGVFAVGGLAQGVVAIGGLSWGLLTVGGCTVGLAAAMGGVALGGLAFGGVAIGVKAVGGLTIGLGAIIGQSF